MPRIESREQDQISPRINRLAAAIRMPSAGRGGVLYLGWSDAGTPTLSWDKNDLSASATESLNITKTVRFSSNLSLGDRNIEPVQYMAPMPSIDKPDSEDEFSEDVMVLGVANSQGMTDYVNIEELSLMRGILDGHVVWQDVNSGTVMGDRDVTPTLPMHSVLLPVQKADGSQVVYAMLFEPTMRNESNEPAFKMFLAQTMKSFLALDLRQKPENKKGYEKVIAEAQARQGKGGDAYFIMQVLREIGFEVPRSRMERVWRESAGKGFGYQLLLVARELGLVDFESAENKAIKGELDKMRVEDLLGLMEMCYDVVYRSFRKGKS